MRLRNRVMLLTAIPLSAMLTMLVLLGWLSLQARSTEAKDTHFDRTQLLSRNIEGGLRGAESAMRGYVATGSLSFLADYRRFAMRVENLTGELIGESDDTEQRARAEDIGQIASSKLVALRTNISLADISHARAVAYVLGHSDDAVTRPVQERIDRYLSAESAVLGASDSAVTRGWRPHDRLYSGGNLDHSAQVRIRVALDSKHRLSLASNSGEIAASGSRRGPWSYRYLKRRDRRRRSRVDANVARNPAEQRRP